MDTPSKLRWIDRLDRVCGNGELESSHYEARLGQLRTILEINDNIHVFPDGQGVFTARLMLVQLERWMGSYVASTKGLCPDKCRPVYSLDEIDVFVSAAVDRFREYANSCVS